MIGSTEEQRIVGKFHKKLKETTTEIYNSLKEVYVPLNGGAESNSTLKTISGNRGRRKNVAKELASTKKRVVNGRREGLGQRFPNFLAS
ncbi:hypothetical protein TNCV_4072571 [Trichonephila clavipes]|uniref:Uncharacterized protein n=1 Tax=Trichonephila clavipes TaxID=2585209 RepID=A0A8X7BGS0_TRICX|nr:hypothetical protein TNCV_4072571 [Trichonephila clavipes]